MVIFQNVLVINRSVLYAVPEEDDMHENMRLDVDNMSYEVTLKKNWYLTSLAFFEKYIILLSIFWPFIIENSLK